MATTPEGKVKNDIKKLLKKRGFYFFSPIGSAYGTHGIPDIIVCAQGRFIGIEVKAPGKEHTVTANQERHLQEIDKSGGVALIAASAEALDVHLKMLGL